MIDADTDTDTEITDRYNTRNEAARGNDGVTHYRFEQYAINTSPQRR